MEFTQYLQLKGYSSGTIATIEKKTNCFKAWCRQENITDETTISHNDMMAYVKHCRDKGISQKTTANYISHIKKYYDYLIKEEVITDNPCSNINIKGIKRRSLHDIIPMEQLESLYHNYSTDARSESKALNLRRNKAMLGLLIYQGLQSEELMRLQVQDLQLREGKVTIHGSNRSASRSLKLETQQAFELMDYINDTRKGLLHKAGKTPQHTTALFIAPTAGAGIGSNDISRLLRHLKKTSLKIVSANQIRASVIVHWLKLHNLRKVQYLAGHKYISSTEAYKTSNLEDLKEDISKYHPF